MNNSLQVFDFNGKVVRTVEKDNDVWFVAKDVCDILGHSNSRMAVQILDDDEKGVSKVYTPSGFQDMTVISESGLYTLMLRSNKDEAKPFRRWVTHDVLPQIRKNGSYSVNADNLDAQIKAIDVERARILQHMFDTPAAPLSQESRAVIQHEVFKIITGEQCFSMLPVVTDRYYSATELGDMFGVSSKKIGKIAKAYGLKSDEGNPSVFGQWRLSKSPYSSHQYSTFVYNSNALDWFKEHRCLFA